jgi:hypothetical protein
VRALLVSEPEPAQHSVVVAQVALLSSPRRELFSYEAKDEGSDEKLEAELVITEDVEGFETGTFPEHCITDDDRARVSRWAKVGREVNHDGLSFAVEEHIAAQIAMDELALEGPWPETSSHSLMEVLGSGAQRAGGLVPGDAVGDGPSVPSLLKHSLGARIGRWEGVVKARSSRHDVAPARTTIAQTAQKRTCSPALNSPPAICSADRFRTTEAVLDEICENLLAPGGFVWIVNLFEDDAVRPPAQSLTPG